MIEKDGLHYNETSGFGIDQFRVYNDVEEQEVLDSLRYVKLLKVLSKAFRRASLGKGSQRHGDNKEFTDQWIMRGLRSFGLGSIQFQIGKKNEEINNLKETEAKVNELLDIIVYAAAGVIYLEEKTGNGKATMP